MLFLRHSSRTSLALIGLVFFMGRLKQASAFALRPQSAPTSSSWICSWKKNQKDIFDQNDSVSLLSSLRLQGNPDVHQGKTEPGSILDVRGAFLTLLMVVMSSTAFGPAMAVEPPTASPLSQAMFSPTTIVMSADPQPRQLDDMSAQLLDAFGSDLLSQPSSPGNGNSNAIPASQMYSPKRTPASSTSPSSSSSDMEKTLQDLQKRKQINPRTHG